MKSSELVKYRKKHGLSQKDLAQKLKVSRGAVAHWEHAEELPEKMVDWLDDQHETEGAAGDKARAAAAETPVPRGRGAPQHARPALGYSSTASGVPPLLVGLSPAKQRLGKAMADGIRAELNRPSMPEPLPEPLPEPPPKKCLFDRKLEALQLGTAIDEFVEELRGLTLEVARKGLGLC
jgi:hypothetical protein